MSNSAPEGHNHPPPLDEATIAHLIDAARAARQNAYAPYSNFPVGAALMLADGSVVHGCNVENASFGGTICAERNAITTAIAQGNRDFVALCVISNSVKPITPCGICRQFIHEFGADLPVIAAGEDGGYRLFTSGGLLPDAFSLDEHQE